MRFRIFLLSMLATFFLSPAGLHHNGPENVASSFFSAAAAKKPPLKKKFNKAAKKPKPVAPKFKKAAGNHASQKLSGATTPPLKIKFKNAAGTAKGASGKAASVAPVIAKRDFKGVAAGGGKPQVIKLKGKKPVTALAVKMSKMFQGKTYQQALKAADRQLVKQQNWIKQPLTRGRGFKYSNPKKPGETIFINKGYQKPANGQKTNVHHDAYVKISSEGAHARFALKAQ